ncbi:MauE/DoxX family redox-associated membrane protein [Roseiconus lacunae]|uniref:Heavy-metal-associated domain-containing protein n=1 Tax=Roseiconus lacunae TaxID=2605694 RepID=A0ABT7PFC2_9BACT|nr:MauE/DoxX family redox-associated membrane protein [Roseiconus lacunae]MDM4015068.1 heavy-metal-associated domain-containing protein [Roseiconus lacunae]
MTTQIATTLKCGSCLSKVRPQLDAFEGMHSWRADLSDPRKLLFVDLAPEIDPGRVVELIRDQGFEASIVEEASYASAQKDGAAEESRFRVSTYKPLFLVVMYVLGASLLMLRAAGTWHLSMGTTYFMGFFFLGFAFFKLLDVSKFADAFATYDIIAKRSRAYALAYPWVEVTLGAMFVTGSALLVANIATVVIMSIGLIGVVSAVRKKQSIQCACLGTAFNLPMSVVTVIENSVMILMAMTMIAIHVAG